MKIVMINGSYKKAGITYHGLMEMKRYLMQYQAVEVELIQLSDYQMAYCTGCTVCYSKGHCPLDQQDGFDQIRNKIHEADGVVLASPNYASQVSGLFKNFIDRMDFVTGQVMHSKYVYVLSTYQNVRGKKVAAYIKEQSIFAGGKVIGTLSIKKDPYAKPISYQRESGIMCKEMSRFYKGILHKNRKNPIEKLYSLVVRQNIMSFSQGENAVYYKGLIAQWHAKGLVDGKG